MGGGGGREAGWRRKTALVSWARGDPQEFRVAAVWPTRLVDALEMRCDRSEKDSNVGSEQLGGGRKQRWQSAQHAGNGQVLVLLYA